MHFSTHYEESFHHPKEVSPGCYSRRYTYLIQNSQAVKKRAALKKAMVKKDVKSKVAAKKWL